MTPHILWRERLKFFLIGVFTIAAFLILTGNKDSGNLIGRYQISAWGANFSSNSGGCGAFIIDTVTGKTQTVYAVIYGKVPQRSVLINNLRKPFNSME